MGRPRYEPGMETAHDRLSSAYWDMLAEMPFHEITVRELSHRANVNHNTFYRHFRDMEEMAGELFDAEIVRGFSAALAAAAGEGSGVPAMATGDMRKVALYARSGSNLLTSILRGALERVWLDAVGVRRDALTPDERMDCDIIFGGIVAAMGDPAFEPGRDTMAGVLARPLGRGMLQALRDIARRQPGVRA